MLPDAAMVARCSSACAYSGAPLKKKRDTGTTSTNCSGSGSRKFSKHKRNGESARIRMWILMMMIGFSSGDKSVLDGLNSHLSVVDGSLQFPAAGKLLFG